MKPTLETDRLVLRPLRPVDAEALARILGDPRRPDYLGERIDDPLGVALLRPLEDGPEIEVGWHLDPAAWGSGYATEAARALLDYAFTDLGLDRVVAVVDPRNEASRRVAERLEMAPDGTGHYYGYDLDRFAVGPGDRGAVGSSGS
jgi:RimJ/RimL family protein N-acetyltransferase